MTKTASKFLFIFMAAAACYAQKPTEHWQAANSSADQQPSAIWNLSVAPVGPGDLLSIYVAGYPEITQSYRVSLGGTITLPVLAEPVPVDQRFAGDVQKLIAKRLIDAGLLIDPIVSVSVLEYRSKPVTVSGAVKQPTTIQALGNLRLLDALSKANGLDTNAGPEIVVSRPDLDGQPGYTRRIIVKDLMQNPDSLLDISLQGGEDIRVPVAEKLYIVGNVKTPGSYSMDQAGGLTVMQAMALCQGTLSFTHATAIVYRTNAAVPGRQAIEIPLKDIMKRRTADFYLQANDILYVPDDSGRRLSTTVVDRILTFGATTGSGLLIWGAR